MVTLASLREYSTERDFLLSGASCKLLAAAARADAAGEWGSISEELAAARADSKKLGGVGADAPCLLLQGPMQRACGVARAARGSWRT